MKKIISLIICIILVCSISIYCVSAQTNYCELFQNGVCSLRWSMELHGNSVSVAEKESFPLDVIFDNIKMKTIDKYVKDGEEFAYIPANVFEEKAKKCFAVVDVNAMRAYEEDSWDSQTNTTVKRKIYDSAKNAYVFYAAGGMGDSTTYVIRGYVNDGSKYTVYSHFIDLSEAGQEVTGTEGKDYFVYENEKYKIHHSLKNVVETDGNDVKFHSWQKISAVPELSGLITPSTKLEEESKPQTGKPNDTSSNQSKPQTGSPNDISSNQSKPSDTTSSTEEPIGSQPEGTLPNSNAFVTVLAPETAKIETDEKTFPQNTVVKVEEIKSEETVKQLADVLKDVSKKFVAYEITAECKNVAVQPNGKVKATFSIPEDYKLDKVAVFYVSEQGEKEKLDSVVNEESKTVVAELSHFSTYVVAETNKSQNSSAESIIEALREENNNSDEGGSLVWVIILIVVILLAGGGAVGFYYFKKKAQ